MKMTLVLTLLLVAFSAVALAEKSIESAALDLLVSRGEGKDDCGWIFDGCEKSSECCEGWVCHKWLCKYKLPF